MTVLAVTGHMDLTVDSVSLVREALREVVARYRGPELVGVSCLAAGADTLFAEEVLAAGGELVAVIPSRDYRAEKVKPDHAPAFDRLVRDATEVVTAPFTTAGREAYEAANRVLLDRADRLVAVWNGQPPGGKGGGTTDVALRARAAAIPVDVVWPPGAERAAA
ncbi:hypothetical protein VSR01_16700 [Actinacidiphila sp. DG2A-62]|uniref:hypothetical protein n=1 Tax=Actinacidiphila sp. DG2A-62 TaxID=3108821 RepID=UPI002DBC20D4|nr:hypothetical protein [Actinacidiphila sp. DG2A-62]MEC3995086.1 hypothetical protein [Actinacidiphila sp. DG2A-62]